MTLFDGIILGVALLSALMGLVRGLTREVLGLASWIGGLSLTFMGMPFAQIIARRYIQNGMMADVSAAVGLFLLFIILFSVISHVLSGLIKHSVLGGIDRSLGLLFGVGRGIVVLCIFQLLVSYFIPRQKQPADFQNNRFAPMIYKGSDLILNLLPQQIAMKMFEQRQKLLADIMATGVSGVTNAITDMATNTLNGAVQNGAVQNGFAQGAPGGVPQGAPGGFAAALPFPTPAQLANNLKQSTSVQQEAEDLARLQPKAAAPADSAAVTSKQQSDMNRFLNLQDVDEESALEGALEAEAQGGAQAIGQ